MIDLDPIKKKLAFWASQPYIVTAMHKTYQEDIAHADIAALVAEVERLREALAYEIETVGRCGGEIERLQEAVRKHRDGWHRSENRMLVDRVVMRAAQARELWAVLDG